jgi:hypothetical protein
MPLTTVRCCVGREVLVEECLSNACSRANKCNFTAEMLASMFATVQDRGERITTTALISKCLRQLYFERHEDYCVEPKDLWASFRGTMFHGQLERFAPGLGAIEEPRFHVELPELGELTGSPDLLDVQRGVLYDYKNTASIPRFGSPWGDHVSQMNINRWLVDYAHEVECNAPSVELAHGKYKGEPVAPSVPGDPPTRYRYDLTDPDVRSHFVPVDWQDLIVVYMDEKGPMPMRCTRSERVPTKDGKGTKAARVADIWPDDFAEQFITEHYMQVKEALVERVLPPSPDGFEGQAHILCSYCPVRGRCRDEELKELLEAALTEERISA